MKARSVILVCSCAIAALAACTGTIEPRLSSITGVFQLTAYNAGTGYKTLPGLYTTSASQYTQISAGSFIFGAATVAQFSVKLDDYQTNGSFIRTNTVVWPVSLPDSGNGAVWVIRTDVSPQDTLGSLRLVSDKAVEMQLRIPGTLPQTFVGRARFER